MKRLTTLLLALAGVTTTGCLATVGGNECTSERCDNEGPGPGSATGRDCSDEEDVELLGENGPRDITIRKDSDFNNLPKGCWGLNGVLRIEGPAITSLEKLGDLVDVNDLEIVDTQLTTFDTLQEVKVYGHVRVTNNPKLTGLENIRATRYTKPVDVPFAPYVVVQNNAELKNISGIKYINESKTDFTIVNNPKLESIELLELTKVEGVLTLSQNGATQIMLTGLKSVTTIDISQNPHLTTVSGNGTSIITGSLTFRGNAKLTSIGNMSSLTHVGSLTIDDNDSLTNLVGLTAMQRVASTVTVSNNQVLASLDQLSRLPQGIGSSVSITNNPTLGYCRAWELDRCVVSGAVVNTGNGSTQTNCPHWCP